MRLGSSVGVPRSRVRRFGRSARPACEAGAQRFERNVGGGGGSWRGAQGRWSCRSARTPSRETAERPNCPAPTGRTSGAPGPRISASRKREDLAPGTPQVMPERHGGGGHLRMRENGCRGNVGHADAVTVPRCGELDALGQRSVEAREGLGSQLLGQVRPISGARPRRGAVARVPAGEISAFRFSIRATNLAPPRSQPESSAGGCSTWRKPSPSRSAFTAFVCTTLVSHAPPRHVVPVRHWCRTLKFQGRAAAIISEEAICSRETLGRFTRPCNGWQGPVDRRQFVGGDALRSDLDLEPSGGRADSRMARCTVEVVMPQMLASVPCAGSARPAGFM